VPDLTVQLRQYAEYALDAVDPVTADEIAGGRRPGRSSRQPGRSKRVVGWTLAAAATVIGLVAVGLADRSRPNGVDVVTQPRPTTSTMMTTPQREQGRAAPGSFASTVRSSGVPGLRRPVADGVAIRAATVTGEAFWVTLPADLPGLESMSVVPDAHVGIQSPTTPRSFLTTISPKEIANGACMDIPPCDGARIDEERLLPSGASYTRWAVGISNERTVTVAMGSWTLVLEGPDVAAAETIAASLQWSVDPHGYLVLLSSDATVRLRQSGVMLLTGTSGDPADGVRIHVTPGCDGDRSTSQPALGAGLERFGTTRAGSAAPVPLRPAYGGRWCAANGYAVEVVTGDQAVLEQLYASLRVTPGP
jgi:hypothetical protein